MTRIGSMDLPERCREIVKLAADGMTNRQIADALQLSVQEVKACLDAVFRKGRGE